MGDGHWVTGDGCCVGHQVAGDSCRVGHQVE